MKLTGKCREDFETWYMHDAFENEPLFIPRLDFYKLTNSMQYGVYVDFFDSVGIVINIQKKTKGNQWWTLRFSNERYLGHFKSRPKSRIEAIKKANEIYNNLNS